MNHGTPSMDRVSLCYNYRKLVLRVTLDADQQIVLDLLDSLALRLVGAALDDADAPSKLVIARHHAAIGHDRRQRMLYPIPQLGTVVQDLQIELPERFLGGKKTPRG